jgi:hypothetical protein
MKKFIGKLLGIDVLETRLNEESEARKKAEEVAAAANQEVTLLEKRLVTLREEQVETKLSPKDRATIKKEPWVGVLDTHVNKDNVRNGFFELDWNEYFVLQLKQDGYGVDGDKDEEIVDRWFRELCANVVVDGDYGGAINTGMLDINTVMKKNQ